MDLGVWITRAPQFHCDFSQAMSDDLWIHTSYYSDPRDQCGCTSFKMNGRNNWTETIDLVK